MILNRLCYASGNSEWGAANPTKTTAKQARRQLRGGLPAGGRARRSSPTGSTASTSIIKLLLTSNHTVGWIFKDDPAFSGARDFRFASSRTSGFTVWMDPYARSRYYKSVVGKMSLSATAVRAGG